MNINIWQRCQKDQWIYFLPHIIILNMRPECKILHVKLHRLWNFLFWTLSPLFVSFYYFLVTSWKTFERMMLLDNKSIYIYNNLIAKCSNGSMEQCSCKDYLWPCTLCYKMLLGLNTWFQYAKLMVFIYMYMYDCTYRYMGSH